MSGPGWHLPANAALHGAALDGQLALNLTVFATLCVLAQALLLAGILLRRGGQPLAHKRWRLEYLPLLLFALLFFALAWRSQRLWAASRYSGADPSAMQVEVVGMQFAWYFRYPGKDAAFGSAGPRFVAPGEGNPAGIDPTDERGKDDFVRGTLVLPAGREVDLRLRALDVIHGFAVPEMRVKQNALPGQTFHIHFTPSVSGDYSILCTQVCGLGHHRMQAALRVLPPEQFAMWVQEQER